MAATHVKIPPMDVAPSYAVGATPQDTFAIPFPFFDPADVLVYVDDAGQTGVSFTITPTTKLNGEDVVGAFPTGVLKLTAPVANCIVRIDRMTACERQTDFPTAGPVNMTALNTDFDKAAARAQDLKRALIYAGGLTAVVPGSSAVVEAGLADAPSDGALYGRENGAWVAVPAATAPVTPGVAASAPGVVVDDYYLTTDGVVTVGGATQPDMTAAFARAWTASKLIRLKARTYYTSAAVTFTASGQALVGAGMFTSTIYCTNLGADVVTKNIALTGCLLSDLTVQHAPGTANGGAARPAYLAVTGCGVNWKPTGSSHTLARVNAVWNFDGILVGGTDFSLIADCIATNNKNVGVHAQASADNQNLQWNPQRCLASRNGAQGFLWDVGGVSGAATCGTITNCNSYSNGATGFAGVGSAACPLNGVRLDGGFYGEDVASIIYLDTYASLHCIRGVFTELSQTANGFEFTPNNHDIDVTDCRANGHSRDGLFTQAPGTAVTGGRYVNNGLGGSPGRQNGIYSYGGDLMCSGVSFYASQSSVTQQYAVAANHGEVGIVGCDLRGQQAVGVIAIQNTAATLVTSNRGYTNTAGAAQTINGNLVVTGDIKSATLHTGDSAFTGTINALADIALSGQLRATGGGNKIDLGYGGLLVGTLNVTGDTATGTLHVAGGSAFAGDLNANSVSLYVNGCVAQNVSVSGDVFKNGTAYANP